MVAPSRHVPALMDEIVEEILLRIPPDDPASLLSAALVSKTWCRLISGAAFRRRLHELHRTPPMLGFLCDFGIRGGTFLHGEGKARFMPLATSFHRLPPAAMAPRWRAVDALHGRILFYDRDMVTIENKAVDLFVCSPGDDVWRLPSMVPPHVHRWSAALLCAAPGCDDHANCSHGPFRVVFVSKQPSTGVTSAYIYSSEQHAWSLQTSIHHWDVGNVWDQPGSRIGNAVYFMCDNGRFCVEYHLSKQQLSVISLPSECEYRWITLMTAENGGLGLVEVGRADHNLYTMSRGTGMDGELIWGNRRVIILSKLLPAVTLKTHVAAVVDALGVILIGTQTGLFAINMKSNQVRKIWEGNVSHCMNYIVPYMTFCTPGNSLNLL
ncbi:hypothetical protein EJB05_29080, partial [Eragrostis curvula]